MPLTGHSSAVPCPQAVVGWVGTIVCQFLGQTSQEEKVTHLRKRGLSVLPCWTDGKSTMRFFTKKNCKPWGKITMTRLPYKLNNFGFWWVGKEESKEKEKRRRCWKSPAMFLKTSIQLEMSITLIQGRKCKRGKTQRIGGRLKVSYLCTFSLPSISLQSE